MKQASEVTQNRPSANQLLAIPAGQNIEKSII
jgi:hypothetical protein